MQREINPEDVPQLMRDGKLEFGMELEFSNGYGWFVSCFQGFINRRHKPFCVDKGVLFYQKARFPLPKLRDGDPVVVYTNNGGEKWQIFESFHINKKGISCWSDGTTRWSSQGAGTVYWEDWRFAGKNELVACGYTEDQINEMMERWGVK